ncbi:hypothetical protein WISP_140068 [Willisornis vidua]|uniref:Cytosolic carboxypeptidase 6 n=1 Tax=Willisornis vidua TaxID=1566151 RepID=A0ABQ9CM97_9PASS|nr:hypothetical protein WISP_140068 [Willisornis vidua]
MCGKKRIRVVRNQHSLFLLLQLGYGASQHNLEGFYVRLQQKQERIVEENAEFGLKELNYADGQRIPSKNVYYYRCPDHRKNYVMSFAFCFDREDDTYQFAYCYPYTYTRLQHYLDNLQRRNMDYFCRELLGLSVRVFQKSKAVIPVKAADPSSSYFLGRNPA